MRLLKFQSVFEIPVELAVDDIELRTPIVDDFEDWLALRTASAKFLQPWEPTWDPADTRRSTFRQRIKRYHADLKSGKSISLFIFIDNDKHPAAAKILVGGITIANIRRGVSQSCTIGYWMGEAYAGRGIMGKTVRRIIPYIFDDLKLHRIEAAAIETNAPSISLLNKCGFKFEGKVRKYLKIHGKWQDHRLYSFLSDDPRPTEGVSTGSK